MFAYVLDGKPLPVPTADALIVAILECARHGTSLDSSLGLSGPGIRSLQSRVRRLQRNHHLHQAARAVAVDDALSDWQRCERLAQCIKRFEAAEWMRVRGLQITPSDWPAWKPHVLRAMQTQLAVPKTAKGLHKVLTETPLYSGSEEGLRLLSLYA
nr:hypothetical protein [uncultured Caldimonas sp.]